MTTRKPRKQPKSSEVVHPEPANKTHEPGTSKPINPNADSSTTGNKVAHPIAEPGEGLTGTERHEISASRGDETPFHSMPQGGIMNLDNLKG
ncbi:MAG TPA: hypothetical protein VGO47_14815 [Chlamydiales bacterium]|jgi:hypothetical protein|nr:hypothetical protein [Chlamydiales bacterium]